MLDVIQITSLLWSKSPIALQLIQYKSPLPWPIRPHWSPFIEPLIYVGHTYAVPGMSHLRAFSLVFSAWNPHPLVSFKFLFKCYFLSVTTTILFKIIAFFAWGITSDSVLSLSYWGKDFCLFYPLWYPQCLGQLTIPESRGVIDGSRFTREHVEGQMPKILNSYFRKQGRVGNQESSWYHHLHID